MEKLLHIVLDPPKEVHEQALKASEKINETFDAYFTLNMQNARPHLTLTQLKVDEKHVDEVIEQIKLVAQGSSQIASKMIDVGSYMGWLWVCTAWGSVLELHKKIATISAHAESTTAEPFLPHITISRLISSQLEDELAAEKLLRENWRMEKITFSKLLIGRAGEHGVFEELLEEVKLG